MGWLLDVLHGTRSLPVEKIFPSTKIVFMGARSGLLAHVFGFLAHKLGSFSKPLYTMFEITHSGSWPSRVRPVIEKVSSLYAIPFLFYIALAACGCFQKVLGSIKWDDAPQFVHFFRLKVEDHPQSV